MKEYENNNNNSYNKTAKATVNNNSNTSHHHQQHKRHKQINKEVGTKTALSVHLIDVQRLASQRLFISVSLIGHLTLWWKDLMSFSIRSE